MTLPVTFRRVASAEFIDEATWYEAQCLNLGVEFIAEIERCIALVAKQPKLYAVVYKGIRHMRPNGFHIVSTSIRIHSALSFLAVFNGNRDPKIWQSRG